MAKVTTATTDVTFVLELSTPEAQYIIEALRNTHPAKLGRTDPVWNGLKNAMDAVGVRTDSDALA